MEKAQAFRDYLNRRQSQLEGLRDIHVPVWKDIADYFSPESGRFIGQMPNQWNQTRRGRVDQKIVNSRSRQVVHYVAGGLHTGLTPQNQPWFRLGASSEGASRVTVVRDHLEMTREEIAYHLGQSNFYVVAQQVYADTALFGQAPVVVTSPSDDVPLHFTPCAPGTYAIDTDRRGNVMSLLRVFTMSVREAAEEFGEEVLTVAQRGILNDARAWSERITVYNLIEPNDGMTAGSIRLAGKPYRSVYWMTEQGGQHGILAIRGFSYNPILCPRWLVHGADPYGCGPGLFALGDSKEVQAFEMDIMRALKKYIDPPLVAPGEIQLEDLKTYPGGVTFVPQTVMANTARPVVSPLYAMQPDFNALRSESGAVSGRMDEIFYVNLFMSLLTQPLGQGVTAREIAERHEEKLMLLAPVLNRMHNEWLAPVIGAAYGVLYERGFLPDTPPEMAGEGFDIEYNSILIQAQKLTGIGNVQNFLQFAGSIEQLAPGTVGKMVDAQRLLRSAGAAFSLPEGALRDEKTVAAMEKAEAEQAAQAQQMQQAVELANMTKDVGSIPNEGNLMASMMSGASSV